MREIKSIGTTSFIISDFRAQNVRFLLNKVDIVQLLYLDSSDKDFEIKDLLYLKDGIEYIAHMPIDLNLMYDDDWATLQNFIENINILEPKSYIIHPQNHKNFFKNLQKYNTIYKNLCVENIDSIEFFKEVVGLKCNICFDAGHAILHGVDVKDFIKKYGENITTYHLHGVDSGKDHRSLKKFPKNILLFLLDFASEKGIDIIIEVFGKDDLNSSIDFLKGVFRENGYAYHRWD